MAEGMLQSGCSYDPVMAAVVLRPYCSQAAVMSCCSHGCRHALQSCYCQGYSHVHGVELHAHQCILVCVMLPCTDMCMLVYIVLTCMYTMCMLMYMVVQCMHTMCMLIYMHMSCMHTNVLVCV